MGLVFCIKSIDLEEVLKVGESRGIVFGYKPLTFFVKSSNIDISLVLQNVSNKYFLCFVNEDFAP